MANPASDRAVTHDDNRPPLITPDELARDYGRDTKLGEFVLRAANAPVEIDDDQTCGQWQDWLRDVADEVKANESTRVAVKAPFLSAEGVVQSFFKEQETKLQRVALPIANLVTRYLQRKRDEERRRREEEARKVREEQERLAREAEEKRKIAEKAADRGHVNVAAREERKADIADFRAAQAADEAAEAAKHAHAKSADLSRTRGSASVGSLAEKWDFEITDIDEIKGAPIWAYIKREHKEQAIRAYMNANAPKGATAGEDWQPLKGVRFFRGDRLNLRR